MHVRQRSISLGLTACSGLLRPVAFCPDLPNYKQYLDPWLAP